MKGCGFLVLLHDLLVGKYQTDRGGLFDIKPLKAQVDRPRPGIVCLFGKLAMIFGTTKQVAVLFCRSTLRRIRSLSFGHPYSLALRIEQGNQRDIPVG